VVGVAGPTEQCRHTFSFVTWVALVDKPRRRARIRECVLVQPALQGMGQRDRAADAKIERGGGAAGAAHRLTDSSHALLRCSAACSGAGQVWCSAGSRGLAHGAPHVARATAARPSPQQLTEHRRSEANERLPRVLQQR
jgi:hypothetical protein